jgi:hypothetical protein
MRHELYARRVVAPTMVVVLRLCDEDRRLEPRSNLLFWRLVAFLEIRTERIVDDRAHVPSFIDLRVTELLVQRLTNRERCSDLPISIRLRQ